MPEGDIVYLRAFQELLSNQEEADTKVIAYAVHALQQQTITQAVIRSASGDTDIIILLICLLSKRLH